MKFEISSHEKYILVATSGPADADVYRESMKAIFNHPDWHAGHAYIYDHSKLDASNLTEEMMKRIGEIAHDLRADQEIRKSATVAPNDLKFGYARMVMVYGDYAPKNFSVFRSLDEAITWICEE